jgi:tRNA-splicing endonuclease subunit Sen34
MSYFVYGSVIISGDPVKFHAHFMVVCVQCDNQLSSLELMSYARLGSTARKTFVIASKLPNKEEMLYYSFQWAEKNKESNLL